MLSMGLLMLSMGLLIVMYGVAYAKNGVAHFQSMDLIGSIMSCMLITHVRALKLTHMTNLVLISQ